MFYSNINCRKNGLISVTSNKIDNDVAAYKNSLIQL